MNLRGIDGRSDDVLHSSICLCGIKENAELLSQDNFSLDCDSNPGTLEYDARLLPIQPRSLFI
jgi:hypothetical protein